MRSTEETIKVMCLSLHLWLCLRNVINWWKKQQTNLIRDGFLREFSALYKHRNFQ